MEATAQLILYVDDERSNRVVFDQAFAKRFRVKSVESGEAALALLAEEPVAVLVTDQRMPGMSGDELLVRVKTLSPDTIRIVVTAYSDLDPILRAVNEGLVTRYIVKPWDRRELEEILRWSLEAHWLGRQNSALQLRLVETERLMTLGQVSAHVLHDISAILSAFSPNLDLLDEMGDVLTPALRAVLEGRPVKLSASDRSLLEIYANDLPTMAKEVRSSTNLIKELITSLRAFQNKTPSPQGPRDADPLDAIRRTITLLSHGANASRSRLDYDGPNTLPRIGATTTELMQILLNLVRNAQQAIEAAGGGGTVVIAAAGDGEAVRFSVQDTGPGIPEAVLARVGTPFFTTRNDGTGLGVAQCKRLVATLGGDLDIQSASGGRSRGTTVTFTIPKSPDRAT
jgi:signal transduction histidine kinase